MINYSKDTNYQQLFQEEVNKLTTLHLFNKLNLYLKTFLQRRLQHQMISLLICINYLKEKYYQF